MMSVVNAIDVNVNAEQNDGDDVENVIF